jgi:hypothetical protein
VSGYRGLARLGEGGMVGLIKIKKRDAEPSEYIAFDLTVWQSVPPTPDN